MQMYFNDLTKFSLPESMAEHYPGTKGNGIKAGVSVQFEVGVKNGQSSIKLTAANANILKVRRPIADTKAMLREQLLGINTKWLTMLADIPVKCVLKEQKNIA